MSRCCTRYQLLFGVRASNETHTSLRYLTTSPWTMDRLSTSTESGHWPAFSKVLNTSHESHEIHVLLGFPKKQQITPRDSTAQYSAYVFLNVNVIGIFCIYKGGVGSYVIYPRCSMYAWFTHMRWKMATFKGKWLGINIPVSWSIWVCMYYKTTYVNWRLMQWLLGLDHQIWDEGSAKVPRLLRNDSGNEITWV